jgi:hypothetical protein
MLTGGIEENSIISTVENAVVLFNPEKLEFKKLKEENCML